MVNKTLLTLDELRTYREYLIKAAAELEADQGNPKKDAKFITSQEWYTDEISSVDTWIVRKEAKRVRDELELKAKKFINPEYKIVHLDFLPDTVIGRLRMFAKMYVKNLILNRGSKK